MSTKKMYLDKEFNTLWQKVQQGENFAFARYGDGERAIMQGIAVKARSDHWAAPNHTTKLSAALLDSLSVNDPNFYHGVSCPCCDREAYYWYNNRVKNKNLTFANLFVNKNYKHFQRQFNNLKRDAVVIANHRGKGNSIGNLNIIKYFSIDDNCIELWEEQGTNLIEKIKSEFKDCNDLLFVVAAGPLSGPIIASLFEQNPHNCYIDFGSSIDPFIHGKVTRRYQKGVGKFANRNCWMFNHYDTTFDISVVVNLYKRPHCLEKQLQAIENQSLKPAQIMLFQDAADSGSPITIPPDLKHRFDIIEISEKNIGVCGRFKFAKKAHSNFVCVLDDDTIPGKRWLESCHYWMQHHEGLYGARGIIMVRPDKYPKKIEHFGWQNPNRDLLEVDFVGHSWFFKKEWLDVLFQAPKSIQDLKICGEDMSFSYQLQKALNLPSFVPPHGKKRPASRNYDLYGSLPEFGNKFGKNMAAISKCKTNLVKYNKAMNILLQQNYQWQFVLHNRRSRVMLILIRSMIRLIPHRKLRHSVKRSLIFYFLPKTRAFI